MIDNLLFLAAAAADSGSDVAASGGLTDVVWKIADDFGIKGPFLISQIISTTIVGFVLYKFAFKPVLETIGERQSKIAEGLQYAEEMKSKLAEAERKESEILREASAEAQKIVTQARDQGKDLLEKHTQEATAKVEDMLVKGNKALELEREKMMSEVRQEVARLVVVTSAKVLDKNLSDADRSAFTESASKELLAS